MYFILKIVLIKSSLTFDIFVRLCYKINYKYDIQTQKPALFHLCHKSFWRTFQSDIRGLFFWSSFDLFLTPQWNFNLYIPFLNNFNPKVSSFTKTLTHICTLCMDGRTCKGKLNLKLGHKNLEKLVHREQWTQNEKKKITDLVIASPRMKGNG